MFEEWNQACRNADHLAWRDVDVLDVIGGHEDEIPLEAGDHVVTNQLAVHHGGVSRSQVRVVLLVGPQPDDVVGQLALRDLAIRRHQEAVRIHA